MFHPMLTSFCFVFNHFFDRGGRAGYRLSFDLRLPNEPAMKIVRERRVNFLTYSAKAGIIEI
jgi:hypothetical protein